MDGAAPDAVARSARRLGRGHAVLLLAAAAVGVVLWGGYGQGWRWTGFAHRALLWDWLHVVLLPLAVVAAPLWLRHGQRLGRTRYLLIEVLAVGFALLVVLGYVLPLRWTGFPGNTLWDWLELLVLPLAIVLIPVWIELSEGVQPVHMAVGTAAVVLLVVALIGGYGYGWAWTGFGGNTLFNWIQLLIAPLLLPIVLVPFVAKWMTAVIEEDERGQ